MANNEIPPGRFVRTMPEESASGGADEDTDYQWAEYNLPVTPATRTLLRDESSDDLDFLGFTVEMNPQTFDNS